MMIKAIISDVGNVLVRFDPKLLDNFFDETIDFSRVERHNTSFSSIFQKDFYDKYERGKLTNEEFYKLCKKEYCLDVDFDNFKKGFSSHHFIDQSCDDNFAKMDKIRREKNIELVLLSNTNRLNFGEVLRIYPHLAEVKKILSYEVNARKPEKNIFEYAVKMTGCDISECLFIDDIEDFVKAFTSLGGNSIVYTPGSNLDLSKYNL